MNPNWLEDGIWNKFLILEKKRAVVGVNGINCAKQQNEVNLQRIPLGNSWDRILGAYNTWLFIFGIPTLPTSLAQSSHIVSTVSHLSNQKNR